VVEQEKEKVILMAGKNGIVRVSIETILSHNAGRIGIFPQGLKIKGKRMNYFTLMNQLVRQRDIVIARQLFKTKPAGFRLKPVRLLRPRRLPIRRPLFKLRRVA